jgi:hypothetical protein
MIKVFSSMVALSLLALRIMAQTTTPTQPLLPRNVQRRWAKEVTKAWVSVTP